MLKHIFSLCVEFWEAHYNRDRYQYTQWRCELDERHFFPTSENESFTQKSTSINQHVRVSSHYIFAQAVLEHGRTMLESLSRHLFFLLLSLSAHQTLHLRAVQLLPLLAPSGKVPKA